MLATCRWTVCTLSTSCSGDLGVGAAVRHEAQHLELALGQRGLAPAVRPMAAGSGSRPARNRLDGRRERGGVARATGSAPRRPARRSGARRIRSARSRPSANGIARSPRRCSTRVGRRTAASRSVTSQRVDRPQRRGRQLARRGPALELRERLAARGRWRRAGTHRRAPASPGPSAPPPARPSTRGRPGTRCPRRVRSRRTAPGGRRGPGGRAAYVAATGQPDEAPSRCDPIGADRVDHAGEHGDLVVPALPGRAGAVGEPGPGPVVADHRGALGEPPDEAPERRHPPSRAQVAGPPAADRPGPARSRPTDQATDRPPTAAWRTTWSSSTWPRV